MGAKRPAETAAGEEEEFVPTKRIKPKRGIAQQVPTPEDLVAGTVVLYWDGYRGVIRDNFEAIDQYWLADEESGELVRDEAGEIVQFKAADLELVAKPPVAQKRPEGIGGPAGGVLILGTEEHMMKILEHFGEPDFVQRNTPQQLLALPCTMCEPNSLVAAANEGLEPEMWNLATTLRPDIHVALRAYHLKYALEQLGPNIVRLEKFFCLASINMPFGQDEIKSSGSKWERHWRSQVCNQIDLSISTSGFFTDEHSADSAARRALGEFCGMTISEKLWDLEVQKGLRRKYGVPEVRTKYTDVNGCTVTALILPEDAVLDVSNGLLSVEGAEGADYASLEAPSAMAKPVDSEEAGRGRTSEGASVAGKTVAEWEKEQEQYGGPKLPPNWIRVTSRSSQKVYYYNKQTKQSTFDMPELPLPEGWTKQYSKTTGKSYYFHAKKKLSTFDRPTS